MMRFPDRRTGVARLGSIHWFVEGDFVETIAGYDVAPWSVVPIVALVLFAGRQVVRLARGLTTSPGKSLLVVPLLAVPQATHYVLDGLVWRRGAGASIGD